ncbi:TPA: EscU/YscU/HrcU family type III secretion system export apparatus switch protein [Escherichia coli]|nr:EscU/YscU/HrcU family type III secretion system export apparatus switch protein [Escherichia coli]HBA9522817.1 EscU/YscU/HrcU family type III secretion system export apparatus switch protein [Escherichia coli]HBA9550935.1 EscU/YscU/HrcU family type III secretion system export apparatus switch protein [Escherichia coli]HBA9560251.1 EscU/YscU/HrcU family type III secretion system export apparatus switch protein [Escherichia coli]
MAQKTEKPTEKKRRDAAKKGQSFKSRDLVTSVVICTGVFFLGYGFSFKSFMIFYAELLSVNSITGIEPKLYLIDILRLFWGMVLPFLFTCGFTGIFVTLIQTRFSFASEALKPNLNILNPVQGLKKIFTVKTAKDFVKSVCYLLVFFFTVRIFLKKEYLKCILSGINADILKLTGIWFGLVEKVVFIFIALSLIVLIVNTLAEFFIHYKDLRMDRHEVKQEFKENEGNPEIKSARKRIHIDILSGEEKAAIRNSKVIMANPTHIAIAIYFNPDIAIFPFIALRCANMKARAAIAYAEKIGVPVVRNVKIARKLYNKYKQHSFITVNDDVLISVIDILIWLQQVESLGLSQEEN